MNEQTQTTEEVEEETSPQEVIITNFPPKNPEPTYESIAGLHGLEHGQIMIVHQVTTGELLISFLILCSMALYILRWFFSALWGR